jgi:tetratricopeptide (TPR) repeat protein
MADSTFDEIFERIASNPDIIEKISSITKGMSRDSSYDSLPKIMEAIAPVLEGNESDKKSEKADTPPAKNATNDLSAPLLKLSEEIRDRITAASLTERYIRALLRLPEEKQTEALDRIIAEALTLKQTEELISEMLEEKPNGAAALNLKAAMETAQGKYKDAEKTLDRAIMSNPRSHYAYYNMARLVLQTRPDGKMTARRYYETGRAVGGPADAELEGMVK